MSLYLEQKLTSPDPLGIHLSAEFHAHEPVVAVASYSQARGGYVTVFDADTGDAVDDVGDPAAQVTALRWHPTRHLLATGWDSGRVRLWTGHGPLDDPETLHRATVTNAEWDGVARLVSVDMAGCLVTWKLEPQGSLQCVFVVDLGQPCCTLLIRAAVAPDVTNLARAAVAGDTAALDLFSDWRPRTAARLPLPGTVPESPGVFACCRDSTFHINGSGACAEVCRHDDGLRRALLHGNALVTLSETLALAHSTVGADGTLTPVTAVKLGGRGREANLAWASPGVVAVTTGELSVRLWDLGSGDSELLEPADPSAGHVFTCLAAANGALAAGTNLGGVRVWRMDVADGRWSGETYAQVRGSCKQLAWRDGALLVNASSAVYLLQEHPAACCVTSDMHLMQTSGRQVEVILSSGETLALGTDVQVLGLAAGEGRVVARGRHSVAVYQLTGAAFDALASFPCRAHCALVVTNGIVLLEDDTVTFRTFQGQMLQTLGGASEEGQPITCEVLGAFITIATDAGFLRLWQAGRRDASLVCPAKNLGEELRDFGEVIEARSDCMGTKVCVSFANAALVPDSRLALWAVEPNVLHMLDLGADSPPRFPLSFRWDQFEPTLLYCVAKLRPGANGKQASLPQTLPDQRKASSATITLTPTSTSLLLGLFTTEQGFSNAETGSLADGRSLAGVRAPTVFLLVDGEGRLESQPMAMLDGLEACDAETRGAVVAFTRLLSLGQSERAFAAIRAVTGAWVWRRLAASCAGAGQLDAAALCLGRAGLARAARHLRLRRAQAKGAAGGGGRLLLGAVAEQLGAPEEAAKIYREAGRRDLLHSLLLAQGRWTEALEECSEHDRVRLRATHHAWARSLEAEGRHEEAAKHFALAGTAARHVPRMLRDRPLDLAAFLDTPDMRGWKGQYLESCGQLEEACETYRACGDHLSLVRVLCFQGLLSAAGEEASRSGHRAACYHVARQHEALDEPELAVRFYTLAKALGSAARICMEHDWADQLWGLSQLPGAGSMARDAAAWFERNGQSARAVTLFHRAGATERAVRLALATHDLDALDKMAAGLGTDNELTKRCADTFVQEGRYQQAVALYAQANESERAIALCEQHNVLVTDELAGQLLPERPGQKPDPALLARVADLAQSQAAFQLAARLLTRAGQKVEAMKALLKSGDTDKVIFFANVCRQREVYVMAANHLQALDWTTQPRILDTIVSFYTKGRAPALLASFYEACARREADEFGDYDKALAALSEAQRSQPAQRTADAMAQVRRFLDVRGLFARGDLTAAAAQCRQLLASNTSDALVRRGDILALLVQACADAEPDAARAAAAQLGTSAARYLPPQMLARFAPPQQRKSRDDGDGDGDGELIDAL